MRGGLLLAIIAAVAAVTLKGPPARHAAACWRWMRDKPCPYAANPAEAVRAALQGVLVGQDAAVNDIVQRFQRWDADYHRGVQYPLVLTFTGSSGVGKTSSALAIARALSTSDRHAAYGGGGAPEPEALLKLDGGLYSEARARAPQQPPSAPSGTAAAGDNGSSSGGATGEAGLRGLITDAIAQALFECNGQVVIVMDEAHKASPAAMQAFLPLLKGRQSSLAYRQNPSADARPTILDATRVVLIMTADVGASELEEMMLKAAAAELLQQKQAGGDAPATIGTGNGIISAHALEERFRRLLLTRDSEIGIDLGSHSHAVVPFLPFTQDKVTALLRHQLARVLGSMRPDSWDAVVFDAASVVSGNGVASSGVSAAGSSTLEALAEALSDGHFTAYTHDNARFAEILAKLRQQQQQQAGKQQSNGGSQAGGNGGGAGASTASVDAAGNVQLEGNKPGDDATNGGGGGSGSASTAGEQTSAGGDHTALSCARAQTTAAFHVYGARGLDATYSNSPVDRLLDRLEAVLFKARMHDKDAPFPADALPPVTVQGAVDASAHVSAQSRATASQRGARAYRALLGCMPAPGTADDVYPSDGRSTPVVDCVKLVHDRQQRVQAAVAEAAARKAKLPSASGIWQMMVTGARAASKIGSQLLTGTDDADSAGEQPTVWPRTVLRLTLACPPKAAARSLVKQHPSRTSQWPVALTVTRCVRETKRVDAPVAPPAVDTGGAEPSAAAPAAAAAVPAYYFEVYEVCLPLRTGPI